MCLICDSKFSFCFGNSSLHYNMLRSPKVTNKITRDIFRATHKGSGGHCSGPNPHLTQGLFNASQRMPESHRENTQIPKAIMFGYAFHKKQIHVAFLKSTEGFLCLRVNPTHKLVHYFLPNVPASPIHRLKKT